MGKTTRKLNNHSNNKAIKAKQKQKLKNSNKININEIEFDIIENEEERWAEQFDYEE